eukprot:1161354-Pelagomonas_calceolata.AAC.9
MRFFCDRNDQVHIPILLGLYASHYAPWPNVTAALWRDNVHFQSSFRHRPTQRTTTANRVRQPHQLNANQRHMHSIGIKYCEDRRPGQHLEAAKRQHADLCKLLSAKGVALHTILLGVGGIS